MSHGWIDPESVDIHALLLMDRWIIRMFSNYKKAGFKTALSRVLRAHPSIYWYLVNRSPESEVRLDDLLHTAPTEQSEDEIKAAEIAVLEELDWAIVYLYPEMMEGLPYIEEWDPERLLSMADFHGKTVLDIGSGTGRLAFAVAPIALWVYASDPVDRLREYLREKKRRLSVTNVRVVDGTADDLPFPDETFDIVMSGHVLGDDIDTELAEIHRVTKPGGFIIDCPGEDDRKKPDGPREEMLERGFEASHYVSVRGGDVYRYWVQKPE